MVSVLEISSFLLPLSLTDLHQCKAVNIHLFVTTCLELIFFIHTCEFLKIGPHRDSIGNKALHEADSGSFLGIIWDDQDWPLSSDPGINPKELEGEGWVNTAVLKQRLFILCSEITTESLCTIWDARYSIQDPDHCSQLLPYLLYNLSCPKENHF